MIKRTPRNEGDEFLSAQNDNGRALTAVAVRLAPAPGYRGAYRGHVVRAEKEKTQYKKYVPGWQSWRVAAWLR